MKPFIRPLWIGLIFLQSFLFALVYFLPEQKGLHALSSARCTYYCEFHGCTHTAILPLFHPMLVFQIGILNRLPGSYHQANLLFYWIAGSLLLGTLGLYLLPQFRYRVRWSDYLLLVGLLLSLPLWLHPALTHRLFMSSVNLCLELSWMTHVPLYTVYVFLFAVVLPLALTLFVVLSLLKYVRNLYVYG